MDKQTLSNYGWLVIVTLVLAVMLALATPFGTYVGDGVVTVANGFVSSADNAIDENNIAQMQNKWEDKLNAKPIVAGATFADGTFLTWNELKIIENGEKYGYDASAITDTKIGDSAFNECWPLKNITIPDSVTSIGSGTFYFCESLTSITIPDSVTSIGDGAFASCTSITSIVIPDSVKSINIGVFSCCYSLTNIKIPNSVTSIGDSAFSCCYSLTRITIPEGVTSIGSGTFYFCTSLANITYGGTTEQWNNSILLGFDWNNSTPATHVNCSDGVVTLA